MNVGESVGRLVNKVFLRSSNGDIFPIEDVLAGLGTPADLSTDQTVIGLLKALAGDAVPTQTIIQTGSAAVVTYDNETTVATLTVTGSPLFLDAIAATGTWAAEVIIYINTVRKQTLRIEITSPHPETPFFAARLEVGDVVEVKVRHYDVTGAHDYEATIKAHR